MTDNYFNFLDYYPGFMARKIKEGYTEDVAKVLMIEFIERIIETYNDMIVKDITKGLQLDRHIVLGRRMISFLKTGGTLPEF